MGFWVQGFRVYGAEVHFALPRKLPDLDDVEFHSGYGILGGIVRIPESNQAEHLQ